MLIDAPGLEGSDLDLGRAVVARTLWALRVTGLERVVVTHPHPDHAAGLPFVLARFRPRELWLADPEPGLERLAAEVGCRVVRVQAGARGKLGGAAALEVLWPPVRPGPALEVPEDERRSGFAAQASWEAQNEHSTVLRLTYGGRAFLFPGDIGSPSERALVAGAAPRLAADVLLSPHHGSRRSNTPEFLAAVHPRAAVLSRGPGTYSNWPSADVLDRLRSAGADLWRTDSDGMVTAATDGRGLWLSGSVGVESQYVVH
jgi:competence protein ComEC